MVHSNQPNTFNSRSCRCASVQELVSDNKRFNLAMDIGTLLTFAKAAGDVIVVVIVLRFKQEYPYRRGQFAELPKEALVKYAKAEDFFHCERACHCQCVPGDHARLC